MALVKSLQTELGIAVLFSAHELNPLLGAMDRVLYLGGGQAALGTVDEVITGPVLSRLYGSTIDVVHVKGRIFVMSGAHDMEHRRIGMITITPTRPRGRSSGTITPAMTRSGTITTWPPRCTPRGHRDTSLPILRGRPRRLPHGQP